MIRAVTTRRRLSMSAGSVAVARSRVAYSACRCFATGAFDKWGGTVERNGHEEISETLDYWGRSYTFKISSIGKFADGAIFAQYGDTAVLNTVVSERQDMGAEGKGFMPLTVDYREKRFAIGEIPGSWNKKEMFNPDTEILVARKLDRSIRPMFDNGFFYDTQVISTVYAYDGMNSPDVVSINGASLALQCSDIPWKGPLAAVRLGMVDGAYVVMPTVEELARSDFDLLYVGTQNACVMIECEANQVHEREIAAAMGHAHKMIQPIIEFQKDFARRRGNKKFTRKLTAPSKELMKAAMEIGKESADEMWTKQRPRSKADRGRLQHQFTSNLYKDLANKFPHEQPLVLNIAATKVLENSVRDLSINTNTRVDNRQSNDLREVYGRQGVVPVVHGSSFFGRGDTQALCTTTFGGVRDSKKNLNSIYKEAEKHFFLHYDFPPYSVKETGRVGGINRRMVGHGALAEKALLPVVPKLKALTMAEARVVVKKVDAALKEEEARKHRLVLTESTNLTVVPGEDAKTVDESKDEKSVGVFRRFFSFLFKQNKGGDDVSEDALPKQVAAPAPAAPPVVEESVASPYVHLEDAQFPYSVRVTSEVTASDGSSSMATVTGATIALLDAGVNIKDPVVGVSMGLVTTRDERNMINWQNYKIITDILGFEDYFTDMDFKCAGSKKGLTAIQLDMKTPGIPWKILGEALMESRDVRLEMLLKLKDTLVLQPKRSNVKRRVLVEVEPEITSAGEIIGRRRQNISEMQEETLRRLGSDIAGTSTDPSTIVDFDVSRDGEYVEVIGDSDAVVFEGLKVLVEYCTPMEVGKKYSGKIIRVIDDLGVVVSVGLGKEGFLHKSRITSANVDDGELEKYVQLDDDVDIIVDEVVEETGRARFSLVTMKEGIGPSKRSSGAGRPRYNESSNGRRGRTDHSSGPRHNGSNRNNHRRKREDDLSKSAKQAKDNKSAAPMSRKKLLDSAQEMQAGTPPALNESTDGQVKQQQRRNDRSQSAETSANAKNSKRNTNAKVNRRQHRRPVGKNTKDRARGPGDRRRGRPSTSGGDQQFKSQVNRMVSALGSYDSSDSRQGGGQASGSKGTLKGVAPHLPPAVPTGDSKKVSRDGKNKSTGEGASNDSGKRGFFGTIFKA